MTSTNKFNSTQRNDLEKYNSRINMTRSYIHDKNLRGLLNNQKWLKIFKWIEKNQITFTLSTLLNPDERNCTFIRELETTSILIDDTGQFIDFLEISKLAVPKLKSLIKFLNESNVAYMDDNNFLYIVGYQ